MTIEAENFKKSRILQYITATYEGWARRETTLQERKKKNSIA